MVGEALKGGRLVAEVMAREGYTVLPAPGMHEVSLFLCFLCFLIFLCFCGFFVYFGVLGCFLVQK
jgi:hypothetical protein